MFERRRARILLAILTLVSLVFITIDSRAGRDGPLARVRDGVATAFGPVQDGLATVLAPIGGIFDSVGELFDLRADNERLRVELEQLRRRHESVEDVARQNEELRQLLEMRDEMTRRSDEFDFVTAEVIALAPSNFEWTVTLNVGSRDGVRTDMTVVSGNGLVGRVVQAGATMSRVLLLVDPGFAAAARVARTGENGVVEGADTSPLRLSLFDPEADVRQGDEVVTSTYRNATFPDGIPIGVVAAAGEPTFGEAREVTVQPYVDFTRLAVVFVILRQPPAGSLPSPSPSLSVPAVQPSSEVTETAPDPEPSP